PVGRVAGGRMRGGGGDAERGGGAGGYGRRRWGERGMIRVESVSGGYGEKLGAGGLDFVVRPGVVAGFPGPDGAGMPVTMRVIAGLDEPTAGRVRVNGRDYRAAPAPVAGLGIVLEAQARHPGRPARDHLPRCGAGPRRGAGSLACPGKLVPAAAGACRPRRLTSSWWARGRPARRPRCGWPRRAWRCWSWRRPGSRARRCAATG